MHIDDTVLYEQFLQARQVAIDLTDHYQQTPAGDPAHERLWEQVTRQTETARQLLESWLHSESMPSAAQEAKPAEPLLV